jgi:anthranilate/para-aminobenzoate synthase component II
MNIQIIDNGTSFITELTGLCRNFGDVAISSYDDNLDISNIDLLILSGGHNYPVLYDPSRYKREIALIDSYKGPIIGICLGFEIIAYWDGGKLERLSVGTRGIRNVRVITENILFENSQEFRVYESHRWSVRDTIKMETLAISDDGVEVIKHPTRPIIGFQFHPEQVSAGMDGRQLFLDAVRDLRMNHT